MMKEFDQDAEEREHEATREEENQEEEEANKAVAPRIPIKPSQEEVDSHMLTHLPFRSWPAMSKNGRNKLGAEPITSNLLAQNTCTRKLCAFFTVVP